MDTDRDDAEIVSMEGEKTGGRPLIPFFPYKNQTPGFPAKGRTAAEMPSPEGCRQMR